MSGDELTLFDVPYLEAVEAAGVPIASLRSWARSGELGPGPTTGGGGVLTSHQVVLAAALSHFKQQKRNPVPGSLAHHRIPGMPFVILLSKERIPVVIAVVDLPGYLARPSAVVVFDGRPVVERLRKYQTMA